MMLGKDQFFEIQLKYFDSIPFNQTNEWLMSTGDVNNIQYFVNDLQNPEIACWGRLYERKFIGSHLMVDGIARKTNSIKVIRDFFHNLVSQGYSIVEVSDIEKYDTNSEIGLRQAGFVRPILSLSPLSLIVNTNEPFTFQRNWKRNVKKATESGCHFEIVKSPSASHFSAFVQLFNQLKERKGLGFSLNEESLRILLENSHYKLFFVTDNNGKYISGRIVYVNGHNSYDVYAANSGDGIRNGAAYFIQEGILNYLKDLGVKYFDFGRISPSNDEMNNIYVAKSYSGGEPVSYNGQWLFSKSKKMALFYELYKFLIAKQRRY